MIEIGSNLISILYADGTSAAFDPEGLRIRLEKSFTDSGAADPWVAGEIVLAVEYALRCRADNAGGVGPAVHAGDIEECVVRILEDTGFAAAARFFRGGEITSGDCGKLTPEGVEQYLTDKFQLAGEAGNALALQVRKAMLAIDAMRCSPRLVLELARHFREESALSRRIPAPQVKTLPAASSPPVPRKNDNAHWSVRRSDSIFASIRAEINLSLLFVDCPLTPPLTEFSLLPLLLPAAEQIDARCAELRRDGAEHYPLLLTLRGFNGFAGHWLCYEYDHSKNVQEKRVRAFTDFFCSLMREKPFKIFVR